MLKLTIITLILIGTVTAVSITGYKGASKKFSLRPIAKDSAKEETKPNRAARSDSGASTDQFPEELQYVINLEDLGEVELDLIRDRSVRVPKSFSRGKSGNYETRGLDTDNLAFYKETNGHGSFACQLKETERGESECVITALLDMGAENCYLSAGSDTLDCSTKNVAEEIVLETEVDQEITPENGAASRLKRAVQQPPQPGFRSIEVAYLPDAKFTDLFYRRHPGDIAAAEAEMDLFFTLLTNDMNAYFSTVDEATSFQLQLQVYAATVAYPGYQMNFPWSENYNDGTYLYYGPSVESNIEFIINDSGFITEQYDFVFAITGFNLRDVINGKNVVSRSHQSVLCTDSRQKYAVSEFTAYNLPRILVHELGHSLGAINDDDTATCPPNVNIMSKNMFNPNSTTKDTYFKFSTCSGSAMVAQVFTTIPDCLVDDAFSYDNDYVPQFCTGYPGTQADYLNKQCERLTNIVGSTACDTVDEIACYRRNQIRCTNGNGQCTNRKLQYVWNGTPCDSGKFCFKGSCVDKFSVCVTTTTQSTSTTTTSTTSTTTTTTQAPSTTTAPDVPCTCCGYRGWRRVLCCVRAHYFAGAQCYCCGSNRRTAPPPGWTGRTY